MEEETYTGTAEWLKLVEVSIRFTEQATRQVIATGERYCLVISNFVSFIEATPRDPEPTTVYTQERLKFRKHTIVQIKQHQNH
jgi:hypothetical protein